MRTCHLCMPMVGGDSGEAIRSRPTPYAPPCEGGEYALRGWKSVIICAICVTNQQKMYGKGTTNEMNFVSLQRD